MSHKYRVVGIRSNESDITHGTLSAQYLANLSLSTSGFTNPESLVSWATTPVSLVPDRKQIDVTRIVSREFGVIRIHSCEYEAL